MTVNEPTSQQWAELEGKLKMFLLSAIAGGDSIRTHRALAPGGDAAAIDATDLHQRLLLNLVERFEALIRTGLPLGKALTALRTEGYADRLVAHMFPGALS